MLKAINCLLKISQRDIALAKLVYQLKKHKKTYLGYREILGLVENFDIVKKRFKEGFSIAEFGVGRGGSAFILAYLANKVKGNLTLFDVFGLIPPPSLIDGVEATRRYSYILHNENDTYYGKIPNLLKIIQNELYEYINPAKVNFVVGYYEDVLPLSKIDESYAFVHIDCDWYNSYRAVLDFLEKRLVPKAILQLDDYTTWEGASKAVAETRWIQKYKKNVLNTALVIDTAYYL